MRPMLDNLELPQVQEIATIEHRSIAEHRAPGLDGSLLQNMGRRPLRVALWGVATGPDALDFVEKLNGKFRAGKPLPFTADIVADASIDQVLVQDFRAEELAGKPQRYAFLLTLREYIEPIEPEDTSGIDTGVLQDAEGLMKDMVAGLDVGQAFVTGLEPFVSRMGGLLDRVNKASTAFGA